MKKSNKYRIFVECPKCYFTIEPMDPKKSRCYRCHYLMQLVEPDVRKYNRSHYYEEEKN